MIPFPLPSSFIAGVTYLLTFIATLRAGSRARYLLQNDGKIGLMDGPYLLPGSNLWNAAYCFESAVDFALTECSSSNLNQDQYGTPFNQKELSEMRLNFKALKLTEKKTEATNFSSLFFNIFRNTKDEDNNQKNLPHSSSKNFNMIAEGSEAWDDSDIVLRDAIHNKEDHGVAAFFDKLIPKTLFPKSKKEATSLLQSLRSISTKSNWDIPRLIRKRGRILKRKNDNSCDLLDDLDFSFCQSNIIQIPNNFITSSNANTKSKNEDSLNPLDSNFTTNPDSSWTKKSNKKNEKELEHQEEKVALITAYAPKTFANLRSCFGIKESEFLCSLKGPYLSFQSNSKGAARSGGFFFFSRDGAYLIKTVKRGEAEKLLEMLPKYYRHMKKNSRKSLLTRFCGMYQAQICKTSTSNKGFRSINAKNDEDLVFIVMNSVFPAEGSKFISERYDLKGSTVGRECSIEEREKKGANAVLKDLDLAKEFQSSASDPLTCGINIGAGTKATFLSQLRRDVELLVDCKVMDYSLLVGVVNMDNPSESSNQSDSRKVKNTQSGVAVKILHKLVIPLRIATALPRFLKNQCFCLGAKTISTMLTLPLPYYGAGFSVVDGGKLSVLHGTRSGRRAIYYMGVIDFLQPWTMKKALERELKGAMGYDTEAISCVDPEFYASRFLNFIDAHLS